MADVQARDDTDVVNPGDAIQLYPEETQKWRDNAPAPDIGSLVGGADKGTISDLVRSQRQKATEDFAITGQADKRLALDQARMDQAFAAEGHAAAEQLKPWDADKEHKRFESDPIQGFGSVGGLFAMVASAFTKAPMENAINGMAGAINSIKEGNEEAYQRAHQSWQENTKLALERFKTQHELYSDALGLMDHDQAAANAKLTNAAVRFGDSQTLLLAEHGMVKELFELQASRAQAAEQMQKASDNITESSFKKAAVNSIKLNPPNTGDPVQDKMHIAAQVHQVYAGGKETGTAEQEAVGRYFRENANKPTPEFIDGLAAVHEKFTPKGVNIEGYRSWLANYVQTHDGKYPDAELDASMQQKYGLTPGVHGGAAGGGTPLTNERTINVDAAQHKQQMKIEHPDWSEDKLNQDRDAYVRERKSATTPTSANRTDDLRSKIDQTDNIIRGSEKQLDFLHRFKGGAGLMGKIMRGEEIAANITGAGTQSDRVEFRRRVHELQEMVPRIITDANGRPLKTAQDKVDDFVAGLNAGDTGPNTIQAYEDLIAEMKKRQQDYRGRIEGGYVPGASSSGSSAQAPAAGAQNAAGADWLSAYPEKK